MDIAVICTLLGVDSYRDNDIITVLVKRHCKIWVKDLHTINLNILF